MERICRVPLLAIVILLVGLACASGAAEPHPEKAVFADQAAWPATAPGEVQLSGFHPFHAVYDRSYTQSSGPGAGEKRHDRVIVHADEVGWEGRAAVAITVVDSAAPEYADTNMRQLLMVAGLDHLDLLFEIGPAPGKAKDYYFVRTEGELKMSMVDTGAQELAPRTMPTDRKGFGPGSWVMASMPLEVGLKIQLAPYYSPQANPISQSSYGRVLERRSITDGSGAAHDAWVVETPAWYALDSPRVLRLYLKDAPPYHLGTEIYDYDTGETRRFVWLKSVQATAR